MFFKKFIKNFLNIYKDDNIRESYGEDFSRDYAAVDPATGKKKISFKKIFIRFCGLSLLALYILIMVRFIQEGMIF